MSQSLWAIPAHFIEGANWAMRYAKGKYEGI